METLGEYLQRHRKGAGYTIEDVARITRINPHYLRALEENDFNRLPAPAFTQGFLRSYARLLSLDEHDVVERFHRRNQPHGYTQTQQVRKPSQKERETVPLPEVAIAEEPTWRASWQDHWKKEKTVYMVVFGVFCLGVIVFLILHPLGRETSNVPAVVEDASVPPLAETSTGTEMSLSETQEAGTNADAGPTEEDRGMLSPQESQLLLTFTAREDCWIRVVIDGGEVRSILLPAGGRIQWSAREKFLVTLGNAGGVEAILNDHPLGSFGERGQVVRSLLITRDGVSSVPGLSVNSPKDFPENRP